MGYKEMLAHSAWLRHRLADEYWTVVAQRYEFDRGSMFERLLMTSVLAPAGAGEKLLADRRWLATDVLVDADASCGGQAGMRVGKGATIEQFAFPGRGARSDGLCIPDDFVRFYDLRLDAGTYVAVDGACEDVDVVRMVNNVRHQEIRVNTRFLRNYLACRGRVLVRQHDNRVRRNHAPDELRTDPFRPLTVNGPGYAFRLEAADRSDDLAASRLLGKDLVMPFRERRDPLAPPEGRCEFVVGIDGQGREVTAAYRDGDGVCGAVSGDAGPLCERPARYLGEDGMCKYCFPVRFRRDVLKKYHESDRHDVDSCKVSCACWSVGLYIDGSGIVEARLGDLARLPAREQHHWRSCNVPPEGIGGRQYTGFGSMGRVSYSDINGSGGFWGSFDRFQEGFGEMFGFTPFIPLRDGDAHRVGGIRVPLNDDPAEFEGRIQDIEILLNDSINVERLKGKLAECGEWEKLVADRGGDEPKGIQMLERFLERESLPTTIIPHLQKIQDLRSSGVAHRKGREFKRNARKLGLKDANRPEFIRRLFADIAKALDATLPDTSRPRAG